MTVDQCLAVNGVYKFEAKVCGVICLLKMKLSFESLVAEYLYATN